MAVKLISLVTVGFLAIFIMFSSAVIVNDQKENYNTDTDTSYSNTFGNISRVTVETQKALGYTSDTIETSNPISDFINKVTLPFRIINNIFSFMNSMIVDLLNEVAFLSGFAPAIAAVITGLFAIIVMLLMVGAALRIGGAI